MKKIFFLLLMVGCVIATPVAAQQEPQFQQNMFNIFTVNPGYAGSNGSICASGLFRKQWVGFVGAPTIGLLNVEAPVKFLKGGVGITIMNDELGLQSTLFTRLSYAYHMQVGPGQLGIGVRAGFVNSGIDGEKFEAFDNNGDPSIPTETVSGGAPSFGFGLYYNTPTYNVGLSSTQLAQAPAGYAEIDYQLKRHYYITAGFSQRLNSDLELQPSLFMKLDPPVAPQFDLSVLLMYNNQFWAGVGYRAMDKDAIPTYVGVLWNDMKFGYSYDIAVNGLRGFNSGSHEIFVSYCFKLNEKVTAQRYRNVRFL